MSIVQPFLHRHSSLDINFWMLVREFIKLIYTITLNAASSFTDIYMKDHWFKTNSWWLWQIKSILIPVWYFCYDYMIVTFEVTIWSKTLIHSTAAYRASQNGSLRKYFFFFLLHLCVGIIRDKNYIISAFSLLPHTAQILYQ